VDVKVVALKMTEWGLLGLFLLFVILANSAELEPQQQRHYQHQQQHALLPGVSLMAGRYRNNIKSSSFTLSYDAITKTMYAVCEGHHYMNATVTNNQLTLTGKLWGSKVFTISDTKTLLEPQPVPLPFPPPPLPPPPLPPRDLANAEPTISVDASASSSLHTSVWTRVERNRRVVEAAVISNAETIAEKNKVTKMVQRSFRNRTRAFPVHKWGAVESKTNLECPTEKQTSTATHTPNKIVGTTIAHTRIWQDFYRRHRFNNPEDFILIFEGDATCSVVDCGSYAVEQLKTTTADVVYFGWCYMNATEAALAGPYVNSSRIGDKIEASHQILPPVCLHAYAVSLRVARFLFNNVFPCADGFGDWQVKGLMAQGKVAWDMAGVPPSAVKIDLHGPRQTKGLWVQPW